MNLNKESIKHYLRQHKIDDFLLEFEAEGLKLLFQELMYEHYYPEKSLMIFRNNIVKSLILNSVWNNKGEEGIKKLSDPEDTTFKDIEVNIKKLKNEISVLATKTNLTKNDVISAFEIFENAAQEYAFFNMAHFEKAYECSDKNEILSKNIGIVENLKDKVKVDFNKIFFFSDCYWTDLLKKICGQFNIDEGLIEWHMKEELLALFEGETVSSNEIEQRKRAYVFYEFENKKLFIKGDVADRFISILENQQQNERTSEIFGMVANVASGQVIGRVKIINVNYDDLTETQRKMSEMDEGDILISRTTDPNLLSACKKAAAIVTDVGGMLSHAAIVSRELGKPCIVGTKIATKVLKDGDLVEVDADNGVVRKIT